MGTRLAVRERKLPRQITLAVEGELDINTSTRLDEAVQRACAGACEELVIDLDELTFIDSSGVRALLNAVRICAEAHCRLEIVPSRHPAPGKALHALGLERRLPWRGGAPAPGEVRGGDERERAGE